MTSSLFASEYIRQRLFTKNDQLLKAKKGCNIKLHYAIGPFVIKSSLALLIVEKLLESLNFQEAQRVNYDPKKIIANRKKINRCGTFEHQEIKGLVALENAKGVINKDCIADENRKASKSEGVVKQNNIQRLDIQTPMQKDKGNNRSHDETIEMEIDATPSSKRDKGIAKDQEVLYLDLEESINQEVIGKSVMIQQDNPDQNVSQEVTSSSKQNVCQSILKSHQSSVILDIQSYQYTEANVTRLKSKIDLIQQYTKKRDLNLQENQKKMKDTRKASPNKLSLLTIKETTRNVLNISLAKEDKVVEMKLKMDQISVPDKIHFHRKANEVLYHDLLQSTLSNKNLERKVIKIEKQLKNEKTMGKSWQTQIKKIEANLMEMGVKPDNKNPTKKLLEEKDKTIISLKKELKILVAYHPQTKEFLTLQEEFNYLQHSTLDLKDKILQLESENESLQKEKSELFITTVTIGTKKPQKITTDELTKAMSQASLKDDEIKRIKEKNGQVDQENNFLREKLAKQKKKLKGKLQLQGTKNLLWDQIHEEVDNFWEYMNYIEEKRALED